MILQLAVGLAAFLLVSITIGFAIAMSGTDAALIVGTLAAAAVAAAFLQGTKR